MALCGQRAGHAAVGVTPEVVSTEAVSMHMHQCTTPAAAAAAAAAACTSGAIWFNSYVSRSVLTYTTLLFLNVLITSGGEGRGAGGNASALGASAACTYHDSHWGAIMMVIVSKELETEAQGNQGVAFDNCKPSEK